MIPADQITINGDAALWVGPKDEADSAMRSNHPCDTEAVTCHCGCDGPCPDCDGTGNHTFDIEVACNHFDDPESPTINCWNCEAGVRTFRVHVVDVLPIEQIVLAGERQFVGPTGPLPPAAEVGQWLVRLAVHS